MTDSIRVQNLSVSFSAQNVLDGIDFNVKSGEIYGLMGLNGAGKTTIIKCILGLRRQDSGQITIFDKDTSSGTYRDRLAYLPEKFEPPWFLTGMEFLKFSLEFYRAPFEREKVLAAAQSLALDERALDRKVQTYSKGMRQKLGILGTFLTNAPLIILDEPMSGLDPQARSLVKDMIRKMKTVHHTIFFSSHILADMDEICDRVALLHQSEIRYIGTSKDLKHKTSTDNLERAFLEFIEKKVAA